MISFTPQSARGIAAIKAQTAPATIAATTISGRRTSAEAVEKVSAAQVAPIAPTWNCPSAPMFQSRIRRQTATARPVSASGIAFSAVCVSANLEPNAPRRSEESPS